MEQPLTTSEVAEKLMISVSAVIKMCNRKIIKSWRVPGSKHRRISREAVRQYLKKEGWPEEYVKQFD